MSLIKAVDARDYLAPRHWLTWALIALMRVVAMLPLRVLVGLGSVLGQLAYWLTPERRRVAEINLKIAFPDYGDDDIRRLSARSFRNLGVTAFELGLCWWESDRLFAMSEIVGLEHLQRAHRQGKGVILLTAHFTCLEIAGPVLSHHVQFQAMYKRPRNPLFDAFMRYHRSTYTEAIVDQHKPIALIKGLKKGHATWYAPDADFGSKDTVFVPFFGVEATALTAPARIAKITGAPVLPYYIRRKPRGRGYVLTILPALEDFPSNQAERDALRINEVVERMIVQNPEQYLWSHKRYKTRPPGQQPIYPA